MNEYFNEKEEIEKAKNNCISKERLIEMLTNLDFIAVRYFRINVITDFTCNGKDDVSTLGYTIEID